MQDRQDVHNRQNGQNGQDRVGGWRAPAEAGEEAAGPNVCMTLERSGSFARLGHLRPQNTAPASTTHAV